MKINLSTQPKLATQPKIKRTPMLSRTSPLFPISFMFITVLMLNSTIPAQVTFTDVTDAVGLGNLQPNPTGAAGGTTITMVMSIFFSSEDGVERNFSATKGKGVEDLSISHNLRMSHNQLACTTNKVS